MKQKIRVWLLVIALIGAAIGFGGYYFWEARQKQEPIYAAKQILYAFSSRDAEIWAEYVDGDSTLNAAYDDTTRLLSENVAELAGLYPMDWFFKHDSEFMRRYMRERRADDMEVMRQVLRFYFDDKLVPVGKREGNAKWFADELLKSTACQSLKLSEKPPIVDGDTATVELESTGDDSIYGRMLPRLTIRLELRREDNGRYKLKKIANAEEIFYPLVEAVEKYWEFQGWN